MQLQGKVPLQSRKVTGLTGNVLVPGDKSISHRALILGSQTVGLTRIRGLLTSEDVLNTAESLRKLGVNITQEGSDWLVSGVGIGGLVQSSETLNMGNSGTSARLMMGLVASYAFDTKFTGDASLSSRPMMRVIRPLTEMGVQIDASEGGRFPLTVRGSCDIAPISYTAPIASAQLKSCIMLAALNTAGKTTVIEPKATRDHTEKMMRYIGVDVAVVESEEGTKITVTGQPELQARDFEVPADPSSAAFLVVAGLLVPNSQVTVRDVMTNPSRFGLYKTLQEMGADISFNNPRVFAGEEIVDITVKSSQLKGIEVPAQRVPSMVDEYPVLAVAAACANGTTIMRGLAELRAKESDRLQAVYDGLTACGVTAEIQDDDLVVTGGGIKGDAEIKTHLDHRLAMTFLVAGMVSDQSIVIDDGAVIDTSFPGFVDLINSIGADVVKCS